MLEGFFAIWQFFAALGFTILITVSSATIGILSLVMLLELLGKFINWLGKIFKNLGGTI